MSEAEQLSELVGDIYDAALDQSAWSGVVAGIARYTSAPFVNIFYQDVTRKTAQAFYTHGIDPEYLNLYFQKYIHINPMFPAALFFDVGRILTTADIMPLGEFKETRFYKEWVRPQGLFDSMASVLEKSPTSVAGIAAGRAEQDGPVDEEALRRMELIVPHVRRSLMIGKLIDLEKIEAAALSDAFDGIAAGALLLEGSGRIVHANASALAMLNDSTTIRVADGKFTIADPAANARLSGLLASLADGVDAATGPADIPIDAGGERYVAHVLPLTSGARRKAGTTYSAVAAVFVRKAAADLPHPVEAMAAAYKLTPAELRVLMAVVQIGGVPEIVPVLGVSENTVKSHLQHVFEKTGATRQADLVKIVAGYMNPVAG